MSPYSATIKTFSSSRLSWAAMVLAACFLSVQFSTKALPGLCKTKDQNRQRDGWSAATLYSNAKFCTSRSDCLTGVPHVQRAMLCKPGSSI